MRKVNNIKEIVKNGYFNSKEDFSKLLSMITKQQLSKIIPEVLVFKEWRDNRDKILGMPGCLRYMLEKLRNDTEIQEKKKNSAKHE